MNISQNNKETLKNNLSLKDKEDLEQFQTSEIAKSNKLFKGIIISMVVINIIFCLFYIVISLQINMLDDYINNISNDIVEKEAILKEHNLKYNQMLIHFYSDANTSKQPLIDLIQTNEEYEILKEWIGIKDLQIHYCYKLTIDGNNQNTFISKCIISNNIIIIIKTTHGKVFGGVVKLESQVYDYKHVSYKNAFIFSFDDKKHYMVKDSPVSFTLVHTGFLMFGNGDIVIEPSSNHKLKGSSNFPISNESGSRVTDTQLFEVEELEAFSYNII